MEHPCDGISYKQEYEEDGKTIKPSKTNFYMVAVPSYFEKGFFKYHVYQLISSFETTHDPNMVGPDPILMFNFEFSPITEHINQNKQGVVEFLISICAIIGGVYTIAGIVDSVIHRSVSYVFKSSIGKLEWVN